jgi:hypothetical protein
MLRSHALEGYDERGGGAGLFRENDELGDYFLQRK